jgi:hypothetical protein
VKKLTTWVVLAAALAGTVGFSSRGAAEEEALSEAEFNAALDARLHEVLNDMLHSGRSGTRGADMGRR